MKEFLTDPLMAFLSGVGILAIVLLATVPDPSLNRPPVESQHPCPCEPDVYLEHADLSARITDATEWGIEANDRSLRIQRQLDAILDDMLCWLRASSTRGALLMSQGPFFKDVPVPTLDQCRSRFGRDVFRGISQ